MPKGRGKHVQKSAYTLFWADDDGSFGAAVVLSGALGVAILAMVVSALMH